jgi:hypothetical protein
VAEEATGSGSHSEGAQERLERRLDRIEQEFGRENRWWRGGLIAALVLVALAILVAGRHHQRPEMGMGAMGMPPWAATMPYGGQCGPYSGPPPWAHHHGCGCAGRDGDGYRPDRGSGSMSGPPRG